MSDVHGPADGQIEVPLTALADLQRKGLVRHIGLSNATPKKVADGRAHRLRAEQYNIAHRDDNALIDDLAAAGIAYVPFFPLGGFTPLQSTALSDVAKRLDATPMLQVALAQRTGQGSPAMRSRSASANASRKLSAGPRRWPACVKCGIADCSKSIGNSPSRWPPMTSFACPNCSLRLFNEPVHIPNRALLPRPRPFELPQNPSATAMSIIAEATTRQNRHFFRTLLGRSPGHAAKRHVRI